MLSGDPEMLRRGEVLGEMAPWQHERGARAATIKGHEPGMIATMLTAEMPIFAESYPQTAIKIMRFLVDSALHKQHANMRNARATRIGASTLLSSPTSDEDIDPSAPEILKRLLGDKGFIEDEIEQITDAVDYFEVPQGSTILEPGQKWHQGYVLFLLRGSVRFDAFNFEVKSTDKDEDGHVRQHLRCVGTAAFFGLNILTDASRLSMSDAGTIAGLTHEQIRDICEDGPLAQKLFYLFSQSAARLTVGITLAQKADDGTLVADDATIGFDRQRLAVELAAYEQTPPVENFHRVKLLEQQRAAVQAETGKIDQKSGRAMKDQMEQAKLMHRMTLQKLRVLESENEAHKNAGETLSVKLKKARIAEKEATQLATRVLAPLEVLHEELRKKIKDLPGEQGRVRPRGDSKAPGSRRPALTRARWSTAPR